MNEDIPILDWFGCYKTGWGDRLVKDAYSHPAKGAYGLAERIYKHALERGYLQRGSTIVDPFGGVCGFGFHAMLNGMHFTAVELEPRFVALGNENIALWNARYGPHLPGWGTAQILQGDSRKLAQVLAQAGVVGGIVSSPPFTGTTPHNGGEAQFIDDKRLFGDYGDSPGQLGAMPEGSPQAILSSPPFSPPGNNPTGQGQGVRADYAAGKRTAATPETKYGTTAGQLGAMPMTGLDAIVSSPPYIDSVNSKDNGIDLSKTKRDGDISHQSLGHLTNPVSYGSSPGQLGSMPEGSPQAIISSPPFVGVEPTRDDAFRYLDGRPLGSTGDHYGTTEGQLGVMPEGAMAGIVSSPPYEGSAAGNQGTNQRKAGSPDFVFDSEPGDRYGDSEGQLGGEVAETFWAAALQIVSQCYEVLAVGGVAIWVCKDFVRAKQRVPFSDQWLALCQHVGFVPVERVRAWVTEYEGTQLGLLGDDKVYQKERKSFFRRLAEAKGSPRIDWEDVLIVRKMK